MVTTANLTIYKMATITTKKKEQDNPVKDFGIGTAVELVTAYMGWGKAKKGDWGVVTSIDIDTYTVFIPEKLYYWKGIAEDMREVDYDGSKLTKTPKVAQLATQVLNVWRAPTQRRVVALENIQKELDALVIERNKLMVTYDALSQLIAIPTALVRGVDSYENIVRTSAYLLQYLYKEISIDSTGRIEAVTQPIYIDYDGHHIPMGEYLVNIAGDIVTVMGEGHNKTIGGFIHPHVSHKTNRPCWGTWQVEVIDHLKNASYLTALEKICHFLSSVASDGWYTDVRQWLPDAEDRCDKCWELEDDCKCTVRICVHCGKDIRAKECKCIVCPASGEIIGKEYDPYCRESCSSWNKKEGVCQG